MARGLHDRAGPMVNLCTGLIAWAAALAANGRLYEQHWQFLAYFATISLVVFATNLIPMRPEALYTDGARIYQLLRGGPVADLHRAFSMAASIWVTPLRPRNFDIQAIQRAAEFFTQGHQALFLRFFAYNYFHDCGQIPEACRALTGAESIYDQSASDIPSELHTLFVFGNAFLKRDAAAARQWWERMQAKEPANQDEVYWLAKSALCWIENKSKEANEAWNQGNALAQQRPQAGAYEFNRDCFFQLRQALDEAQAAG